MRVAIDPMVIAKGLTDHHSYENRGLVEIEWGRIQLVTSVDALREMEAALRNGDGALPELMILFLRNGLLPRENITLVAPQDLPSAVPEDPLDDHVFATAVAGGAEVIVSTDHHQLDVRSYQGIPIVSPAAFMTHYSKKLACFDSSVIVGGLSEDSGSAAVHAMAAVGRGSVRLVTSESILGEFEGVMRGKHQMTSTLVYFLRHGIAPLGNVTIAPSARAAGAKAVAPLLAAAVAAKADLIVTSDRTLLRRRNHVGIPLVSPYDFLVRVGDIKLDPEPPRAGTPSRTGPPGDSKGIAA